VEAMSDLGVRAIVVLGGDGTSRLVASRCRQIPLCPLSTGTNNAFPEVREATVAGLATGLVATDQVPEVALRREKILRVALDGDDRDCALVDVARSSDRFVGARALWKPGGVSEIVVASANPDAVGLSSVAGLLDPVPRSAPNGLYVRLTAPGGADLTLTVPLAPGLVVPVGIAEHRRVTTGETVELRCAAGSVALDGERELEVGPEDRVAVTLDAGGPLTVDVGGVMREAARRGLLNGGAGVRAESSVADFE
jgi:predicted polyphosphate/ATP-dependent NAD kinase